MASKNEIDAFYVRPRFDYASLDASAAAKAQKSAKRIRSFEKAAAIDIGRELLAIKDALPHGRFLPWIEAEFGYSRRTATNMMAVATTFCDTWEAVSHLPPTVLYQLAAPSTPDAVREAVVRSEPGKLADPNAVKRAISRARDPDKARITENKRQSDVLAKQEARHAESAKRRIELGRGIAALEFLREKLSQEDFLAFQKLVRRTTPGDLHYLVRTEAVTVTASTSKRTIDRRAETRAACTR